jgi:hypothetical protein
LVAAACTGGGAKTASPTATLAKDAEALLNQYWGDLIASQDDRALASAKGPVRAQAAYRSVLHRANPATKLPPNTSVNVVVTGVGASLPGSRYQINGTVTITVPELAVPLTYKDFVVEKSDAGLKLVDYADDTGAPLAAQCVIGDGVPPAQAGGFTADFVAGIYSSGTTPTVGFALVLHGHDMVGLNPPGPDATFTPKAGKALGGPHSVYGVLSDGTGAFLTLDFPSASLTEAVGGGTLAFTVAGTTLTIAVPAFG